MISRHFSDKSVRTIEGYPTPDGYDSFVVFQLDRNRVIVSHGGVFYGSAKFTKGQWVSTSPGGMHSPKPLHLEILQREAPGGPADIKAVAHAKDNPTSEGRTAYVHAYQKKLKAIRDRDWAAVQSWTEYARKVASSYGLSQAEVRKIEAEAEGRGDNPAWSKVFG